MLKYSKGIKALEVKHSINNRNKGMELENEINISNTYYRNIQKALIYKKPTPIKIIKAIHHQNTYKIIEAYFMMPSTTDYNGLYKGKYIDFEAKETMSLTSFPLSNIHDNQIDHLLKVDEYDGISFLIVRFSKLNEIYFLHTSKLKSLLKENKKSIPLNYFKENGFLIKSTYICPIDYLKIIDEYYL